MKKKRKERETRRRKETVHTHERPNMMFQRPKSQFTASVDVSALIGQQRL